MKPEYIKGFIIGFLLLCVYSYRGTDNSRVSTFSDSMFIKPLLQKNIVVTTNHDYVLKLIKNGYICEDVDVFDNGYTSNVKKYYTMVKY